MILEAYISDSQVSGTVPLYRFRHIPNCRHFYTADETEKDNVEASGQYVIEGKAGYVKA